MSKLDEFLARHADPMSRAPARLLFAVFGDPRMTAEQFALEVQLAGYERFRAAAGIYYRGLSLDDQVVKAARLEDERVAREAAEAAAEAANEAARAAQDQAWNLHLEHESECDHAACVWAETDKPAEARKAYLRAHPEEVYGTPEYEAKAEAKRAAEYAEWVAQGRPTVLDEMVRGIEERKARQEHTD